MMLKHRKTYPLVCFASLFYNQTIFKKIECCFFDQVAINDKSVVTFEKCPLVAQLNLRVSEN